MFCYGIEAVVVLLKRCSWKICKIHRKIPVRESKVCNFIEKETLAQVFSCEFCEISKNTFFLQHLRWLLLVALPWTWSITWTDKNWKILLLFLYFSVKCFAVPYLSLLVLISLLRILRQFFFFSIWVFFHNYSRITINH